MEKLIELLNEYEPGNMPITRIEGQTIDLVISKRFGFIKWLVENKKIDFEGKLNTIRFESLVDQTLDSYLALLMLLSIQDEAINFLISILK